MKTTTQFKHEEVAAISSPNTNAEQGGLGQKRFDSIFQEIQVGDSRGNHGPNNGKIHPCVKATQNKKLSSKATNQIPPVHFNYISPVSESKSKHFSQIKPTNYDWSQMNSARPQKQLCSFSVSEESKSKNLTSIKQKVCNWFAKLKDISSAVEPRLMSSISLAFDSIAQGMNPYELQKFKHITQLGKERWSFNYACFLQDMQTWIQQEQQKL